MQSWRVYSKRADFKAIGDHFGIDQVIARIIRNRDIEGMKQLDMYINGGMSDLHDSMMMKDMPQAIKIMADCIQHKDKIRIIGDYDIDGICSIYILFKGLIKAGADVDYDVPDRITDGYGINENLIKKAYDDGRNVIITCDNGIAAIDEIEYAKELNMTVIVTDHHDVRYTEENGIRKYCIPNADAVVDPKRTDCEYPFKLLCGAGIAYKFIGCLYDFMGIDRKNLDEFIDFAAIATVGDIVDLIDENRVIVKEGLKHIALTDNYGLRALMDLCDLDKNKITSYAIGFVIGPCLNASGRLSTAKKALAMLLADNEAKAYDYAKELKALNDERKKMTLDSTNEAFEIIDNSSLKDDRVLVVVLPKCHESIAGIVAGRVRERYYKPTIVLTEAQDGLKGSARSIEGYNMFESLLACSSLLTKFGGHPMAAGMSLEKENADELRKQLNENCTLTAEDLMEKIWIDVPMPIDYINESLINQLDILAPFGKGNEKPVFADKNLRILSAAPMGKEGQYIRMTLEKDNGVRINAVGFFEPEELLTAYKNSNRISCTYYPEINEFRDKKSLQIQITGYKIEI